MCCGKCDKCATFYPIYRGGRSLYKNRYNKYYQQFKRLNKITYEQFKAYMIIAGNIRDTFLANENDDVDAYQEEVKRQIAAWTYK